MRCGAGPGLDWEGTLPAKGEVHEELLFPVQVAISYASPTAGGTLDVGRQSTYRGACCVAATCYLTAIHLQQPTWVLDGWFNFLRISLCHATSRYLGRYLIHHRAPLLAERAANSGRLSLSLSLPLVAVSQPGRLVEEGKGRGRKKYYCASTLASDRQITEPLLPRQTRLTPPPTHRPIDVKILLAHHLLQGSNHSLPCAFPGWETRGTAMALEWRGL